jgi:HAD superfamily hydrolase (TIGR01450 family)
MLDLDGVVYVGRAAVDGVPDLVRRLRDGGMTLAFVTNNASRTPDAVAAHLRELGISADASDVVTSAQAAARELAQRLDAGADVLVIGGEGLRVALDEEGLTPVQSAADDPVAVVQGFDRSVGWEQLAQGAYAIRAGALWVAANLDLTVPTAGGIAPGNGTLVNAVAAAVDARPAVVAGKPYRPLFDETVRRLGCERPIVVGDRLDTDIEGANTCGADSLLVMTGVTDLPALCAAPPTRRPTFLAWTMAGLLTAHPVPQRADDAFELNGWRTRVRDGELSIDDAGSDRSDGLRVVVAAAWAWRDDDGAREPVTVAADVI